MTYPTQEAINLESIRLTIAEPEPNISALCQAETLKHSRACGVLGNGSACRTVTYFYVSILRLHRSAGWKSGAPSISFFFVDILQKGQRLQTHKRAVKRRVPKFSLQINVRTPSTLHSRHPTWFGAIFAALSARSDIPHRGCINLESIICTLIQSHCQRHRGSKAQD